MQKLNEGALTMIKMLILSVLILFINLNIAFPQVNDQEFMVLLKIALNDQKIENFLKNHESKCKPNNTKNDRFILNKNIPLNSGNVKYKNKTVNIVSKEEAFFCMIKRYGIIENYKIEEDNACITIKFFDKDSKGNKLLIGKLYFVKKKKWKLKKVSISK